MLHNSFSAGALGDSLRSPHPSAYPSSLDAFGVSILRPQTKFLATPMNTSYCTWLLDMPQFHFCGSDFASTYVNVRQSSTYRTSTTRALYVTPIGVDHTWLKQTSRWSIIYRIVHQQLAYLVVVNVCSIASNDHFLFNPRLDHSILLRLILQSQSVTSSHSQLIQRLSHSATRIYLVNTESAIEISCREICDVHHLATCHVVKNNLMTA